MCTCMYVCLFVCMYVCMYAHMYVHMHACMHACMDACMHVHTYMHVYVRAIYVYTYIYIYCPFSCMSIYVLYIHHATIHKCSMLTYPTAQSSSCHQDNHPCPFDLSNKTRQTETTLVVNANSFEGLVFFPVRLLDPPTRSTNLTPPNPPKVPKVLKAFRLP